MKRSLLILLLASLTACSSSHTPPAPERTAGLLKTWWRAEEIEGTRVGFMPGQKTDVYIILYSSLRMVGSGGCNHINASFSRSSGTIRFGAVSSTRMVCFPAVLSRERAFIGALRKVETFAIDGYRLRMYDHAGREVLRFLAVNRQ